MEQLSAIRKAAAEKYANRKVIPKPVIMKGPSPSIPVINYIFNKLDCYYILINDKIVKLEETVRPLGPYSSDKHCVSEFGKSVNEGYVKTVNVDIMYINNSTYLLPFSDIKNYRH